MASLNNMTHRGVLVRVTLICAFMFTGSTSQAQESNEEKDRKTITMPLDLPPKNCTSSFQLIRAWYTRLRISSS